MLLLEIYVYAAIHLVFIFNLMDLCISRIESTAELCCQDNTIEILTIYTNENGTMGSYIGMLVYLSERFSGYDGGNVEHQRYELDENSDVLLSNAPAAFDGATIEIYIYIQLAVKVFLKIYFIID